MPSRVWHEITYPFLNFNSCTIEVWGWISNFILHFIMDVISYPWWDYTVQIIHGSKRAPSNKYMLQGILVIICFGYCLVPGRSIATNPANSWSYYQPNNLKNNPVRFESKFKNCLKEIHLKMSSAKWQPFCVGLTFLIHSDLMMPYDCYRVCSILDWVLSYRLFGIKQLSETMLKCSQYNTVQWKFNKKNNCHWNVFENVVCKMAAILLRPLFVNLLWPSDAIWQHSSGST